VSGTLADQSEITSMTFGIRLPQKISVLIEGKRSHVPASHLQGNVRIAAEGGNRIKREIWRLGIAARATEILRILRIWFPAR